MMYYYLLYSLIATGIAFHVGYKVGRREMADDFTRFNYQPMAKIKDSLIEKKEKAEKKFNDSEYFKQKKIKNNKK